MSHTSSKVTGSPSGRHPSLSRARASEAGDGLGQARAAGGKQLGALAAGATPTSPLPKVRRTLTLDAAVVAAFEDTPSLSAEVNRVLCEELRRRVARAELESLVGYLDAEFGAPDAAEVAYFTSLLSE